MMMSFKYAHLYTAWDKQWDYAATRIRSHEFVVTLIAGDYSRVTRVQRYLQRHARSAAP
jgi:hypothetical protein